jgi:hypothetical protein
LYVRLLAFSVGLGTFAGMADALEFNWSSSDGTVRASLGYPDGINRPKCVIYNFATDEKRKGNGRRALQELRKQYSVILVEYIGDESNPNRPFWFTMAREGLVDVLIDFDNGQVWP